MAVRMEKIRMRLPQSLAIHEQHSSAEVVIPRFPEAGKPRGYSLQPDSDVVLPGKFLTHVEPKC